MTPSKTIILEFVTIQIQEHFVISTIEEGVTIDDAKLNKMFEIFTLYYKHRPFVSIANRAYDYTIDPNLLSNYKHPELLGIAVVCHTDAAKKTALFEQKFYDGQFEIFDSIEEAKEWSLQLLEDHLKNAGL